MVVLVAVWNFFSTSEKWRIDKIRRYVTLFSVQLIRSSKTDIYFHVQCFKDIPHRVIPSYKITYHDPKLTLQVSRSLSLRCWMQPLTSKTKVETRSTTTNRYMLIFTIFFFLYAFSSPREKKNKTQQPATFLEGEEEEEEDRLESWASSFNKNPGSWKKNRCIPSVQNPRFSFIRDPAHGNGEKKRLKNRERNRVWKKRETWNGRFSLGRRPLRVSFILSLPFSFFLDSCSIPCHERISPRLEERCCNVVAFSRAVNWQRLGKRSYRVPRGERWTGGKGLSTLNWPLWHS